MRKFFPYSFLLIFLVSCQSDPTVVNCYQVSREKGGRKTVISITLRINGNDVVGEQSTLVTDQNSQVVANASGTLAGRLLDDIYLMDYTYESEGAIRIAEEEFKQDGENLLLTMSAYRLEDGKEMMKERGLFNVSLSKIECP